MLNRLQALDRHIRLGICGMGSVGKGVLFQSTITPAMEAAAIADLNVERAIDCARFVAREHRVVETLDDLHDALRKGLLAICEDATLVAAAEDIDVFIDCSTAIAEAARFDTLALEMRKHVVMMNAEADLIFGPHLLQVARANGVVYTSSDGDQPAAIQRLIHDIELWGFQLVMAGNIKGYMDRYVTPTSIIPEADKRGLDYKMCTSYTDGTKLNIEMALVANAIGASASVPGMHGPRAAHVREVFDHLPFSQLWDGRRPLVDYVLGAEPTGGVFVIGYSDNQYQQSMLAWFPPKMGAAPFYLFYRPYHLCHIEIMRCVAEAFLDGTALLQPTRGFQTNVFTYAKRDLRRGEQLDGIGGYACYGLIENCNDTEDHPGLPICLAEGAVLRRDVGKDEKILSADVEMRRDDPALAVYARAADQLRADTR